MIKQKKTRISIVLFLVIIGVVFLAICINKQKKKYVFYGGASLDNCHFLFVDVHLKLKDNPQLTKEDFEKEFQSKPSYYEYHMFKKIKYNTFIKNDSLFIYEFGFDGKDDSGSSFYYPLKSSFLQSFFIKGDILLYKNSIYPKKIRHIDTIGQRDSLLPQPPPPLPLKE